MQALTVEPPSVGFATVERIDRVRFEIRPTEADPAAWDLFGCRCGATFRAAYRSASIWQLKHHLVFLLRRYDIIVHSAVGSTKSGQFAIGLGRHVRVFGDTLQLLPEYQQLWPDAMRRILEVLGPGTYAYGSDWTTERSRAAELAAMPKVRVLSEKCIDLYAVDFSPYSSWEQYHSSVSKNARRNEAAALRAGNTIATVTNTSGIFFHHFLILILKTKMFHRKKLNFKPFRSFFVSLTRIALLSPYIFIAKASWDHRARSLFCGLRFGRDTYYLEGASVERPEGAAWHLLISMLRLTYEDSGGRGKCVLGPDDGSERNTIAWENLRRQRLQCRARPFATSIVTFTYRSSVSAAPET